MRDAAPEQVRAECRWRIVPKQLTGNMVLVEAIDLLLSFESWNRLREDQGLGIAKSKQVLKQAIESLLEGQA